jgi:hypothetical protein
MVKNQIINIEKGNPSKIYGFAFGEPKSGYEIAKNIGTQPHHVNKLIKHLHAQGYLNKIENDKWRWPRWQSNIDSLIDKIVDIKKKQKMTITDFEKKILKDRLSESFFRRLSSNTFKTDYKKKHPINSLESILSTFEILMSFMMQFDDYIEECKKIKTSKQYEEAVNLHLKEISRLYWILKLKKLSDETKDNEIEEVRQVLSQMSNRNITRKEIQSMFRQLQNDPVLKKIDTKLFEKVRKKFPTNNDYQFYLKNSINIPMPISLLIKIRGISEWGRKYLDIEEYIQMFTELRIINSYDKIEKIFKKDK